MFSLQQWTPLNEFHPNRKILTLIYAFILTCTITCFCVPRSIADNIAVTVVPPAGPIIPHCSYTFGWILNENACQFDWSVTGPGGYKMEYNQTDAVITFNATGQYTVTLNVYAYGPGCGSGYGGGTGSVVVNVVDGSGSISSIGMSPPFTNPASQCDITHEFLVQIVTNVCSPPSVLTFDFGDGTPIKTGPTYGNPNMIDRPFSYVYGINESHYTTPGTYTVTAHLTNPEFLNINDTKTYQIVINPAPPVIISAVASANPASVCSQILFTAAKTGGCYSTANYTWDFGDGTTSTASPAYHQYTKPGTYTVKVTSDDGLVQGTQTFQEVINSPLTLSSVSSSANPASLCDTINFAASASDCYGSSITYSWNFGDGSTGTGANPSHKYQNLSPANGYTVTVVASATDNGTTYTATQTLQQVVVPFVITSVGGYPNPATVCDTVQLNQIVDCGQNVTYSWNFGDGTTASGKNPVHQFNAPTSTGSFTVTLTVTSNDGSYSASKSYQQYVTPVSIYSATASPNPATTCDDIYFYAIANMSCAVFKWTFGDGSTGAGAAVAHQYTQPSGPNGYTVTVTATTLDGLHSASQSFQEVVGPSGAFPSRFTITDLGTLGGSGSRAYGLSSSGSVVGSADTGQGWHAFLWTPTRPNSTTGQMADLGVLPQGVESTAFGINDNGQITGSSYDVNQGPRAFLNSGGTMTDLTTLGGSYSNAFAINSWGQAAGQAQNISQEWHATTAQLGSQTDVLTGSNLGFFLGSSYNCAYGINDNGELVGEADTFSQDSHAFFYSPVSGWSDLGLLPGGIYSNGSSLTINDLIAGEADNLIGDIHGFVWDAGVMQDLGTLPSSSITYSSADAINQCGVIAGTSYTDTDPMGLTNGDHAVVWVNGQITDLNTLIPSGSNWILEKATAINSQYQIAGYGMINGQEHAFLLTQSP